MHGIYNRSTIVSTKFIDSDDLTSAGKESCIHLLNHN